MKKPLVLLTLALTLSGLSAMGQGYFLFSGPARGVWDGFSLGLPPHLAASLKVGFLWGPTNATPIVSSIAVSTPTNGYIVPFGNSAILNDPNFQLAVDNNTTALASVTVLANGGWSYSTTGGFSAFPVSGTAALQAYKVFVIAWSKDYATPQEATAAGFPLGWSNAFIYNSVDVIGTPSTFTSSGFVPFGIVIPEPSSLALASLGGVATMLLRRRNKVG